MSGKNNNLNKIKEREFPQKKGTINVIEDMVIIYRQNIYRGLSKVKAKTAVNRSHERQIDNHDVYIEKLIISNCYSDKKNRERRAVI